MRQRRKKGQGRRERERVATKAPPTLTQIEAIENLNRALGTSYAVPASEADARFLIDGMVTEERKLKRSSSRGL